MSAVEVVKYTLLILVLVYAAGVDLKQQIVHKRVYIIVAFLALFKITMASIIGAIVVLILFLAVAVITPGEAMGGGDVKLMTLVALCFPTVEQCLMPTLISCLLALFVMPIIRHIKRKNVNSAFPFVPFICAGTTITIVLGVIK